jgi:hypothetical protein
MIQEALIIVSFLGISIALLLRYYYKTESIEPINSNENQKKTPLTIETKALNSDLINTNKIINELRNEYQRRVERHNFMISSYLTFTVFIVIFGGWLFYNTNEVIESKKYTELIGKLEAELERVITSVLLNDSILKQDALLKKVDQDNNFINSKSKYLAEKFYNSNSAVIGNPYKLYSISEIGPFPHERLYLGSNYILGKDTNFYKNSADIESVIYQKLVSSLVRNKKVIIEKFETLRENIIFASKQDSTLDFIKNLTLRTALSVFAFVLINVFYSLMKYNSKLKNFYQARFDALNFANTDEIKKLGFEKSIELFEPKFTISKDKNVNTKDMLDFLAQIQKILKP